MNAIAAKRHETAETIDTVCCACHKVAWHGRDGRRRWIDAGVYESLVGALSDPVSHGLCPSCLRTHWADWFPGTEWQPAEAGQGAG